VVGSIGIELGLNLGKVEGEGSNGVSGGLVGGDLIEGRDGMQAGGC
jgi:hypothetical protein